MNASEFWQSFGSRERWGPLVLARAPQVVTWVLVLALGVQAALIVTNLAGAASTAASPTGPATAASASAAPTRRVDLAAIVNAHLFGRPDAGAQPGADAANAPQTTMALVLAGVLAQDDPQRGLAIVGENAAAAKLYTVGDTIPGGVRLHSVYSDRVILDRGGALESLALPRQSAPGAAPPALPPLAASGGNPIAERVRRLVEENPSAVGDIMRPQPVFAQGKQRGYRVYPGRNRAAFVQLGLRPGDLVTAINGTPLDDPARGEEIFRTIGSQPEVRVSVTRNGRQQELVLNMAQAASAADQLAGMEGMAPIDPAPPPGEPVESE